MKEFNILAVDDEVYNLQAIERSLRAMEGYVFNYYSSTNPVEALQEVKTRDIHLLITDQRMPSMTGIELLQEVLKYSPHTIRIILTAFTDTGEVLDAINLGHVYRYITKPWDTKDFTVIIRQALDYYTLTIENELLSRELQLKNQELQRGYESLKKLDDLKNRFMMVASHELRTPATIITSSLEFLNSNNANFTGIQTKILHNALRGSLRLNEIIETFFEMMNSDSNDKILNPTVIELKSLIELIVSRIQEYAKQRNIEITTLFTDNLTIMGDRRRIYLVFENLLSNALKYTQDNGLVEISGKRENTMVKVAVKDTGIGIPSEELENIFSTFYQLGDIQHHHTSKHEFMGGGTGVGLSLCRSILMAHHGKIWAVSDGSQKGSTFFVTLPHQDK